LNQQVAACTQQSAETQLKADRLAAECAALRSALADVTRSPSWRITAPIRSVKRLLRPGEKAPQ
jgi:hypothetical protein